MELGQRIRQARLEAGLSQRQLCGEEITRNMLSLIENGTAKPSMKTLQYLAARLGKSISYFLEETAVLSPNQAVMAAARDAYDAGRFPEAAAALEGYRSPDPVFDREWQLLSALVQLELARDALRQKKNRYAAELLKNISAETAYLSEELDRKRLLLLGSLPGQKVSACLPSLDGELLVRAQEALGAGQFPRAARLLDAVERQDTPQWNLLRGEACLRQGQWQKAAEHLKKAEPEFPRQVWPKLEECCRELGDFRQAYEYACKQR